MIEYVAVAELATEFGELVYSDLCKLPLVDATVVRDQIIVCAAIIGSNRGLSTALTQDNRFQVRILVS